MKRPTFFPRTRLFTLTLSVWLSSHACAIGYAEISSIAPLVLQHQQEVMAHEYGVTPFNADSRVSQQQSQDRQQIIPDEQAQSSSDINLWGLACSIACLIVISRQQARSH